MTISMHLHTRDTIEALGRFLQSHNNKKGIVLCAEHPYPFIASKLTAQGVRTERMLFVDCISKKQGHQLHHENNVLFADNLKDIAMVLQTLSTGHNYIVVDDASSLLQHNAKEETAHFFKLLNASVEKPVHVLSKQSNTPHGLIDVMCEIGRVVSEHP